MCLSLAEPDSGGFSKNSVFNYEPQANKKFFDPAVFQKCWRGGASSPHLRSKLYLQQVFPAAIAFFEAVKFKQSWIMRIRAANSDKATGQLQHAGRQKQGWNPLLPDAEDRFP